MPDFTVTSMLDALSEDLRQPTMFYADYYVITPNGSRTRFTRSSGLQHINMARSETAVLFYLRTLHPKCEVIIQGLDFK